MNRYLFSTKIVSNFASKSKKRSFDVNNITPKGEKISQRYTTKLISFGFFLFWSIVCIGSDARFVAL